MSIGGGADVMINYTMCTRTTYASHYVLTVVGFPLTRMHTQSLGVQLTVAGFVTVHCPLTRMHTQSLGVLLTVAGFVTVFMVGSFSNPDFPHAIVGIVLTFILIQQFLSGIL